MQRGTAKAALIRMKARGVSERLPCAYSHRACAQPRLENYDYCLRHILEDKGAPFKQCSFTAPKTNRRCANAAPKSDRKEGRLCLEHARKLALGRQRAARKTRPKESAESLLEELAASSAAAATDHTSNDTKRLRRVLDSVASKALEFASSSDSDTEVPSVVQAWRRDNDSDAESIDSEQEDPLKHAGVYSQEEAALLLRDKLIRLQSLYIDQFKRLQHVLREKRRRFLQTHKQEREMLGPIQAYKHDPQQRKKYERLCAMRRYHKVFGKEALLHQKCNLRRIAVAEGVNHRPPVFSRCSVATPDGRCNKKVVPLSKYCMAHILLDQHQVLFEACRFRSGQCGEPVFSTDAVPLCRRHLSAAAAPSSTCTAAQTEEQDPTPQTPDVPTGAENNITTSQPDPTTAGTVNNDGKTSLPGSSSPALTATGGAVLPEGGEGEGGGRAGPNATDGALDESEDRLNSSGDGVPDFVDLIRYVDGEHIEAMNDVLEPNLED